MKVKSLLFGTMIALAFTACSNNDDPIDNGGSATTDGTTLEVSANFVNTKTIGDAGYFVYVFSQSGSLAGSGAVDNKITLSEAGNYTFVIVDDSHKPATTPASIADVTDAIDYVASNESMEDGSRNSCVYSVACVRGKVNMAGYTTAEIQAQADGVLAQTSSTVFLGSTTDPRIPVYRNVGLINLTSVAVGEKEVTVGTGKEVVYTNPTVVIDSVFILDAHAKALRAPSTNGWWLTTEVNKGDYVNGVSNATYAAWWADAQSKDHKYVADAQSTSEPSANLANDLSSNVTVNKTTPWTLTAGSPVRFVAYENTSADNPTLLVIKGDFTYTAKDGKQVTESNRYWTIKVGESFTKADSWTNLADFGLTSANFKWFRRNIQYNMSLTITGPGSKNPLYPGSDEVTYIQAAVKLVPYGTVNQSGSID